MAWGCGMLFGGSTCDGVESPRTVVPGGKSNVCLRPVSSFIVICAVAAVAWWRRLGGAQTPAAAGELACHTLIFILAMSGSKLGAVLIMPHATLSFVACYCGSNPTQVPVSRSEGRSF